MLQLCLDHIYATPSAQPSRKIFSACIDSLLMKCNSVKSNSKQQSAFTVGMQQVKKICKMCLDRYLLLFQQCRAAVQHSSQPCRL